MTELLPCPFCGAHGSVEVFNSENYKEHYVYIKCTNLYCAARSGEIGIIHVRDIEKMSNLAIKAWNTRQLPKLIDF